MKKRFYGQILPLALLLALFAVIMMRPAITKRQPAPPFEKQKEVLDTFVTVKFYHDDKNEAEKLADQAFAEMTGVERLAERHYRGNQVDALNDKAKDSQAEMAVDKRVLEMAAAALKYAELSGGAFDPTIGALVDLWDIGSKKKIPSKDKIARAKSRVDYRRLKIEGDKIILPQGFLLELGGVFKGYAVDRAIAGLKKAGVDRALVSTVSSTKILGTKPKGQQWQIGIESPRRSRKIPLLTVLSLGGGWSISSSGDYQRYFIKGGKRYHHIIDPKTGKPAEKAISATVLTKLSAMEADILSTALVVLGPEKGLAMAEKLPGTEALIVDTKGKVHFTRGMSNYAQRINREIEL